jgi:hypothetical protein
MQTANPSLGQILVICWVVVSFIIEYITTVLFLIWLRRQGATLIFGLTGIPWYLEKVYIAWCKSKGKNPNGKFLKIRAILLANLLIGMVIFVGIIMSFPQKGGSP